MAEAPINPYAPPKSDWVHAPNPAALTPQQWWFEGDVLVVLKSGSLPADLCVKTGEAAEKQVTRTLSWVHPLVAISVILSPIIFIILYFIFRKTGPLSYGVSRRFLERRRLGIGLIVGSIALLVIGGVLANLAVLLAALVIFVVGLIAGIVLTMPFQLRKIDKERIYLKVDDRFRAALAARR